MLRSGGGAGVMVVLHGEARGGEALEEVGQRLGLAFLEALRVGQPFLQIGLDHAPCAFVDGMFAEGVRDEPVRAAGDFGREIRIAGGGHFEGGGADDGVVGDDGERGGAGDGLLEAVDDHGGAVGGVSVDGGGGGDAEVAVAFRFRGGELRQIVDGSGTDGDGGLPLDDFAEFRNVAVVGVEGGFDREDVRFGLRDARVLQQLGDLFTGGLPCVFVRDDDGRLAGPEFFDVFGDVFQDVVAEHAEFGLKTFGNCDDAHDLLPFGLWRGLLATPFVLVW